MEHFNKAVWTSKNVFLKQSINPVRNKSNSFTVFMLTLLVRLELSENTLPLPKHGDIIPTRDPNKRKWDSHVLSRPLNWYEDATVFCMFIFIFCLEPRLRKDTRIKITSTTVIVIFWKVSFLEVLVQSSFSKIMRCIDNSILNTKCPIY